MRYVTILCAVVALAGCRSSEQCSAATSCATGTYQACTDGSSCRYLTSDGKSFACGSCADCASAVSAAASWCGVPGTGGNGAGGGVTQTQACIDYLSCAAAVSPAQLPALITTYGPSGSCWTSATMAGVCDSACMMALAQLRTTPNLPAACGGSGGGGSGGGGSGGGGGGGRGGGGGGGGGTPGDMAMGKSYQPSTVAQMRQNSSGDYELGGVISIGRTPSTSSPRLFVQDAAGGDFSAILTHCSSTSPTHPCAVASTVAAIPDGMRITVRGTYVKGTGGDETFYIDDVVTGGGAQMPAPVTAQLADISRNATTKKWWFQRVRVDLGASTLKMYDFSPSEFKFSATVVCPAYLGWGMVPSTSSDTIGGACNGTTQPPTAVTGSAPADELLLGNDFYTMFSYTTDCACAAKEQETLLTATSTLTGTIGGILVGETVFGSAPTVVYQYLAPKSTADVTVH